MISRIVKQEISHKISTGEIVGFLSLYICVCVCNRFKIHEGLVKVIELNQKLSLIKIDTVNTIDLIKLQ